MRLTIVISLLLCAAADARLLRQTGTTIQPLSVYTGLRWNLQDVGVTCPAWNSTEFVPDASVHTASIARLAPDQAKLDAYVAKLCADSTGAGATLDSDLLAGGPNAQLAFLASTQSCTESSPKLAQQWFPVFNPNQAGDFERVLKSLRAWVAAADAQGIPACAAAVAVDKYGDVVELRQLYAGSSNMAASPAGGNGTGGGTTPIIPPVSPVVPIIPGGGLPTTNSSNTIFASVRMSLGAVGCPTWNGTGFGTDTTRYWAAASKPAAIDWDEAMEMVGKLCASPALAGPTLLAAFEKPGKPEANNAVAASIQSCPGTGDSTWVGWMYIKTANPKDDHSDGSQAVSYAEKWVAAADAAGYALCVGVGQFDPNMALVQPLRLTHNPISWSGTGKPGVNGVFNAWTLPDPDLRGQPTACKAWNGTGWAVDGTQWKGTVANPAPVDQTQFKAYVNAICANEATAGATLAAALKAGGATAQLAAYTMLYKCTDNSTVGLSQAAFDAASPFSSTDTQRAISFAKAWRDALDAIGYPACITVSLWDNGNVVSQTQVHPGGETPVGGGGGITPPVIAPPTITFDRAN